MSYPIASFRFNVNIGGANMSFQEVSGLTSETAAIEYRGGNELSTHKQQISGLQTSIDVTLKRGVFQGEDDFYTWMALTQQNTPQRRNVTVSLLNEEGDPVVTWSILNAWPYKIESTSLKAEASEIAIDTIVLKNEGINTTVH